MIVGLISDTHNQIRPEVYRHFEGVQHILHAGDMGSVDRLTDLEALAPVTAVWGNTDSGELRARLPEIATIELAGRRIIVVHGHQVGSPNPRSLRAAYPGCDLLVFGHTHKPLVDRDTAPILVNPGAAGPARFGLKPSLAILTLPSGPESVEFREL